MRTETIAAARDETSASMNQAPIEGPLLEIKDLKVHFPLRKSLFSKKREVVRAVDGVSLSLYSGKTLGLVGESGSGKSTIARSVLRLSETDSGSINFMGQDLTALQGESLRQARRDIQMVFQDPTGSLNPRMKVAQIIAEPLVNYRVVRSAAEAKERVAALLEMCGLSPDIMYRTPHAFSGGQRQRIAFARAIALEPRLIVADEPTSALDVSVQAQIVNLMADLQERLGLAYLIISHDLSVVRHLSNRIAVMYAGKIVEEGSADQVCETPQHPYTKALLSASPIPDPAKEQARLRIVLQGEIPSSVNPPSGCRFHPRCPLRAKLRAEAADVNQVDDWCVHKDPPLEGSLHQSSACWFSPRAVTD